MPNHSLHFLESLSSQLKKFNSAKIVIGCHGAGFTNLVACSAETIFIEFNTIDLGNNRTEGMYKRISNSLNIKYYRLDKTIDMGIDIKTFNKILNLPGLPW